MFWSDGICELPSRKMWMLHAQVRIQGLTLFWSRISLWELIFFSYCIGKALAEVKFLCIRLLNLAFSIANNIICQWSSLWLLSLSESILLFLQQLPSAMISPSFDSSFFYTDVNYMSINRIDENHFDWKHFKYCCLAL